MDLEALKYPIGQYQSPEDITEDHIAEWIQILEYFPKQLRTLTAGLSESELALPYRPDGWNIKQVVHHCADSHMNSIIRFKWALTEDTPTIKAYHEDRWAILNDYEDCEILDSLAMLDGIHSRLTSLLKKLDTTQLKRSFIHPEHGKAIALNYNIGMYAWHSQHHLAHVEQALRLRGTFNL